MNPINRKADQPGLSRNRYWHVSLAIYVVVTGCGGEAREGGPKSPGHGGAGASGASTVSSLSDGGASASGRGGAGVGGVTISLSIGGTGGVIPRTGTTGGLAAQAGTTGGIIAQAGATGSVQAGSAGGGQADLCPLDALQYAVQEEALIGGQIGICWMTADSAMVDTYGQPWGAVLIDSDGRLVAVTGPAQRLTNMLTDQRYPCAAGWTFLYWCRVAA
jgi:hypothetical protein